MIRLVWIAALLAGCSLDLGGLDRPGAGSDAGGGSDAGARDAATPPFDGSSDTGPGDAGGRDAARPRCQASTSAGVLALYTFDGEAGSTTVADHVGGHRGMVEGGTLETTEGPEGCGDAMLFPGTGGPRVVIDASPDWMLDRGAVDLWLRVDATVTTWAGLVGRDAGGDAMPGHLSIAIDPFDRLWVRLQAGGGNDAIARPVDQVTLGHWMHVGVSFGPSGMSLWVDGERFDSEPFSDVGISGNDNPWMIGASLQSSAEGSARPIRDPFLAGAIDTVRIASEPRDFSDMRPAP